jgi:hypothetical protein
MASIAADRVIETLRDVDKGVVPWFKGAAKSWLDEVGDPEEALALALAKITGEAADLMSVLLCVWCWTCLGGGVRWQSWVWLG